MRGKKKVSTAFAAAFGYCKSNYLMLNYRRRLRRVIAAPPNNSPKQSADTVWPSSPSQGSAGRGQGENSCNDFRCEFFLLDKTYAAKNAEVHEQNNAEIMFFLRFGHDFGGLGPSQRQLRRQSQKNDKSSPVSDHSGRLFWSILGSKSDFCAFCL